MTTVANAIAAAKLAESASTWTPTCAWNWVANTAPSGGVIAKKVNSESKGAPDAWVNRTPSTITAATNDSPLNTTQSCAARRCVSTPSDPSAPSSGRKGMAHAAL